MALLCMKCFQIYKKILGGCPLSYCNGNIREIDELLLSTIIVLNRDKGLYTSHSCASHEYHMIYDIDPGTTYGSKEVYISFDEFTTIPSIPEGFEIIGNQEPPFTGIQIREITPIVYTHHYDLFERQSQKFSALNSLLKWAIFIKGIPDEKRLEIKEKIKQRELQKLNKE